MSENTCDCAAESGRDTGPESIIDLTELVSRGDDGAAGAAVQDSTVPKDTLQQGSQPSPLLAGMVPGLVDRVSGLAHDLDRVRDKMEQLSLRQSRIEQAQRRAAGCGVADAEDLAPLVTPLITPMLAPLNTRLDALEAREQPDMSGLGSRLNECEEQLALCVTRADLEQSCTAILDKHLPAALAHLTSAEDCGEKDTNQQTGQPMNQSEQERLDDISSRLQTLTSGLADEEPGADAAQACNCPDSLPEEETVRPDGQDDMLSERLTALEKSLASAEESLGEFSARLASGLKELGELGSRMQAVESSLASLLAQTSAAEQDRTEVSAALAGRLDILESWRTDETDLREEIARSLADSAQELASLRRETAGAGEDVHSRLTALEDTVSALAASAAEAADQAEAADAGDPAQPSSGIADTLLERLDAQDREFAALRESQQSAREASQQSAREARETRDALDALAQKSAAAEQDRTEVSAALAGRLDILESWRTDETDLREEIARSLADTARELASLRRETAGAGEDLHSRLTALEDTVSALGASAADAADQAEAADAGDPALPSSESVDTLLERLDAQDRELAALRESQKSAREAQDALAEKCAFLASRMTALEGQLGEENLEKAAARACLKVLREEIAAIMQGGREQS